MHLGVSDPQVRNSLADLNKTMTTVIHNNLPHPLYILAHAQDGKIESQTPSIDHPYIEANSTGQIVTSGSMVIGGGILAHYEHDDTTLQFEHADPFVGDNEHSFYIRGDKSDEYIITKTGNGLEDHSVITYSIRPASAKDIA